jgi:hypothetical protein
MDIQAIANELLDLWEKAHDIPDGAVPDYDRLKKQYAIFAGADVDLNELHRALQESRKARGWSDSRPDTLEPTIESAIINLWRVGLRDRDPTARPRGSE